MTAAKLPLVKACHEHMVVHLNPLDELRDAADVLEFMSSHLDLPDGNVIYDQAKRIRAVAKHLGGEAPDEADDAEANDDEAGRVPS